MRLSWRLGLRVILIAVAVGLLWMRLAPRQHTQWAGSPRDLSVTSPLNQPGSAPVAAEAYDVYSALYQAPVDEPLMFAEESMTDIPQVGGSCLKPSTPEEHAMTGAFVAANQQSHRWEAKFAIPQGYRVLAPQEVTEAQHCLQAHGHDADACKNYERIQHVRFLGVPGFNGAHTRALVSVIKNCGGFCGSGGIFAVEKTGDTWKRAETTDFTRDCSWIY